MRNLCLCMSNREVPSEALSMKVELVNPNNPKLLNKVGVDVHSQPGSGWNFNNAICTLNHWQYT